MYRKQQKSIIKHMDFLILDILMLIISYIAATIIRDGWHSLRANAAFLTMLGVLILLQVMVALQGNNYNDILRRGYLVELKCVLIQNAIVLAAAFTFMFITKIIQDTKELDKIIEKIDNATNIKENKYEIKRRYIR